MKITFVESLAVCERKLLEAKKYFEKKNIHTDYYLNRDEDPDIIIERAKNSDILCVSNIPITKKILDGCPNLKFLNVAFTGLDHIDLEECKRRNIIVKNAASYATQAVAELTLALAINLMRNINFLDKETRNQKTRNNFLGTELYGKTVGIIGFGAIGETVANLFSAFSCKIIAYNRTPKKSSFVTFLPIEEIFSQADIISLHIPFCKETNNFINENLLRMMKVSSLLINTARGGIIDYNCLSRLLTENKIAGAAIDVYEHEPPIENTHPMFSCPNTILIPHIGYATKEAMEKRFNIILKNIDDFLDNYNIS